MSRLVVAAGVAVSVGIALGCTSPPIAHPGPKELASADAELLQGCYDCLVAARASYRRFATGAERRRLVARVFEADLLLAVREKELSLPPSDAIADARRLAAELAPELEAPRYLALIGAIPRQALGTPGRDLRASSAARAALLARLEAEQAWLSHGRLRKPVRDYLRLALECAYPAVHDTTPAPGAGAPATPPADGSPLLAYRAAICGLGDVPALSAVRAREPRFIETSLFIAYTEIELAGNDGPGQARAHLDEALARFPASPAITFLLGRHGLLVGNDAEALQFYDRTLAIEPAHDQALRGRTICLSNLGRSQEAIDAVTRLIALAADSPADLAEGYYWRAWNRHTLAQLAEARADISAAKDRLLAPAVLTLAGIIEHDQGDLDPAEADLEAAIDMAGQDCTARWYLALVHRQRKRWLASGRAFEDAMACFRDRARTSTERIHDLQARGVVDPAFLARTIASLEASIEADTRQQHRTAFVAASCDAAGGDVASARALLDRIGDLTGEDPALADRMAKLRGSLDRQRPR